MSDDVTPKTESGRALLKELRSVEWGNEFHRSILAIEQEAASKAVAEVLLRLERRITKLSEGYVSQDRQMGYDVALALIRQERPQTATPADPQSDPLRTSHDAD